MFRGGRSPACSCACTYYDFAAPPRTPSLPYTLHSTPHNLTSRGSTGGAFQVQLLSLSCRRCLCVQKNTMQQMQLKVAHLQNRLPYGSGVALSRYLSSSYHLYVPRPELLPPFASPSFLLLALLHIQQPLCLLNLAAQIFFSACSEASRRSQ